jgi:hypothetical protein
MDHREYIKQVYRAHEEMLADAERMVKELKAEEEAQKGNYEDLRTLRDKQWLMKQPPKRKFIFNYKEAFGQESGFLPAGKACMIASPGGCGKTFLLTHCALAAATGTEWLHGKAVEPIKVLFVAAEEDESELWNRFYNMAKNLQFDQNNELLDKALDNIIAIPQRGRSQNFIDRGKPTKSYEDLKETLNQDPAIKLVILDPAIRFMGSDTEISNAAATDWVNLIDGLTLAGGYPTVLVAHHTNKTALRPAANDKTPVFDQSMCRGASALVDGFRWVLGLHRSEGKDYQRSIFIKLLKSNYSHMGKMIEFELDFERGGVFRLIGEVSPEALAPKKVAKAWDEAYDTRNSYGAFSDARET